MANTKSAKKRILISNKKATRNKSIKSRTKTAVKKALLSIENGGADEARANFTGAVSFIDRAVSKGVVHKNTAARKKSRLAKKLNKTVGVAGGK